ncbi:ABC exporter membrane fusion protein [Geitlerinema calcuttense]|uniref:ABC exporter membrane fusion protein n=1 Tax=Geitlerinema calcuttense NRMC-F 0142 TaxID=2922238 RepID=A0ABT7M1L1_9CYAN|nr:ABC exporter membrane fusion protein [Geitlerinema calcuttense]MDL5057260.1 ABC exporter membrane fusion protein [Geitlerinema calcuttense NRMC-F 0142]
MSIQGSLKSLNRRVLGIAIAAVAFTGASVYYAISQFGPKPQTPAIAQTTPTIQYVTALGRLLPETEVIRVSAPLSLDKDRLAELNVQRGDRVEANQIIAILDSRDRLENALNQAQERLRVAEAKLAQVKAGAKSGEINAQQATIRRLEAQWQTDTAAQQAVISRLEAQLQGEIAAQQATVERLEAAQQNAEAEYRRHEQLYKDGAISTSLFDSKRLTWETQRQQLNEARVILERIQNTGRQQLNEARVTLDRLERTGSQQVNEAQATLEQIAEVRPVDVQAAQAEVDAALADVKKAESDLNQVFIRAPIGGRILEVHTRPGETLSDNGVVDLGQTDRMEAIAEVYQTDVGKIRSGQTAIITSDSFDGELRGTVRLVGLQVGQQSVFSNQPGENLDRKVVEVRIRLNPEDSQRVADLTHLQVQVAIQL